MQCPNCGNNLDNNARFCTSCGAKIEPSQEYVSDVSSDTSGINDNYQDESNNDNYKKGCNDVNKEKIAWKNTYTYLIVGLAIILAIVGGMIVRNKKANGTDNQYVAEVDSYVEEKNENSDTIETETEPNVVETEQDDIYSELNYEEYQEIEDSNTDDEIFFVKNTSVGLNLRNEPKHESALVYTVEDYSTLMFLGEVGEGYGIR